METATEHLPDDPALLKELLLREIALREKQEGELKKKSRKIEELEELVRFFKAREFAPKREAFAHHPGQGTLFNEAEKEAHEPAAEEEDEQQTISYKRKRPKRKPLPAALPRKDIVYDLPEDEKKCSCGTCLAEIGEEVSEQLDVIPAKFQVLRHVRKKYACRSCEETVKTAALPAQPIPKSNASPGLLAYIATSKYVDGLPLHRIERIFSRIDCNIPRSTQAGWMIKIGELLTPLINLMAEELLAGEVLHIDETTVQVLKEKGRDPRSTSYMWVMARGDPGRKIILFHYNSSRSSSVALRLAGEYQGYLVTDGYDGYSKLGLNPSITHCGCWDHARRKFHDVVKGRKKGAGRGIADEALELISLLYDVERRAKSESSHRRWILRDLYSRNILKSLERFKNEHIDQVAPKSLLGKAIRYLDNQWEKLTRFLADGEIPVSNALVENAIRPFAVGRRAWLFSDTAAGAEASAAIYSVTQTAMANGVEPYAYLRHIFEQLPRAETLDDVAALLPWNLVPVS